MHINDRALLVQLSISQWTARKHDKRVSSEVAASHNTTTAAGRYHKALLPMNQSLDDIHKMTSAIRQRFYTNTLPWGLDGMQMLPTANYLEFMAEFRTHKAKWEALVATFIAEYDTLRDAAKVLLGSLYNEDDYPTADAIGRKFKIDLAVFPVPSSDFRVSLADGELSAIQADVEARVKQAQSGAMLDAWQRLYDHVERISQRLGNPDGRIHDSLIENAREMCALLPRLNFADDPNLDDMRREVEARLVAYDADDLRKNEVLRTDTVDTANDIMARMRAFMGGSA